MTQYIDKSAIVAEIEKRIKETQSMQPKFDQFWAGQISAFKGVLKILDTLEVKEVDLEKEIQDYIHKLPHSKTYFNDGLVRSWREQNVIEIAKHFYELGLKTKGGEK